MKLSRHFFGIISAALLLSSLSPLANAAETQPQVQDASVAGTVTYHNRMALPPQAQVTVTLADISIADAPAKILSQIIFPVGHKQVPFSFTLPYTQEQLSAAQRIAVISRIELNGQLLFISDTVNEVLTNDNGNTTEVVLKPAAAQ